MIRTIEINEFIKGIHMNQVMIAVIVILLIFAYRGHSKGLAMEIASVISVCLSLIGLAVLIRVVGSYINHNTNGAVQALIFFVALAFLSQIIKLIIVSLKFLTKLPVIHWLNSFAGMIIGIAEGVLIVWALFIVISKYDIAGQSENWLTMIEGNTLLSFLYTNNPFLRFFV